MKWTEKILEETMAETFSNLKITVNGSKKLTEMNPKAKRHEQNYTKVQHDETAQNW